MGQRDTPLQTVRLSADGHALELLDQRALPGDEVWLSLTALEDVAVAIETLAVRGAPAIGCAAALGLHVVSLAFADDREQFRAQLAAASVRLARTRPTAVNLFVALEEQRRSIEAMAADATAESMRATLRETAIAHIAADLQSCHAIGSHGAPLMPHEGGVLTHCNAGALATAGYGTALGVIRSAWAAGKRIEVYADETRPLLQGARLTSWELHRDGIPVTVIADNMAGALMSAGRVHAAVVGADRITRNGDVANKIGTYTVAVLCKHHGIPFYVAAPWTTIDLSLATGDQIPIEQRDPGEVRHHGGRLMTPPDIAVANPAFDVTPAALVTKIITDRGVYDPGSLPVDGGRGKSS